VRRPLLVCMIVGYILPMLALSSCSFSVAQPTSPQREVAKDVSGSFDVSVENTSGGITNTPALKLRVPVERLLAIPETDSVRGLGLTFFTDAGVKVECGLIFGGIPLGMPSTLLEQVPGFLRDKEADARSAGFPDLNCLQQSRWVTHCSIPRRKEHFAKSTEIMIMSFSRQGELPPYVRASIYVGLEQHMDCRYPRSEVASLDQFESRVMAELNSWNKR
jgi:hypothetical protein